MSITALNSAPERVLKVSEVKSRLRLKTDDSVYRLIQRGDLRALKVGRLIRVPESALREFLAGGGEDATE